jgi:hypothetical protein
VAIERLFQSFRAKYDIAFDTEDARDYEQEIETLADTWLSEQEDRQASQAKLKEIYNKINAILPPHNHGHDDPNQPFCELALVGGPPHRGTLLEPVSPKEAVSDLDRYGDVLQELASGITMGTGLSVVMSRTPGWIGVQCDSEEMAIWGLCGMIAENVIVRREGSVLYLPASPKYTLESGIKDVVTACAKVFHYWNEHIAPLNTEHDHDVFRATEPEQAIRVAKGAS